MRKLMRLILILFSFYLVQCSKADTVVEFLVHYDYSTLSK